MINVNKQMQNKKKIENILIWFKFDLTKDLKTQIQTQVKENLSKFELSPVDNKTIFYSQKEINHLDKPKSSEIDFKPNDNNQNISKIIEFRKKNIDNNFRSVPINKLEINAINYYKYIILKIASGIYIDNEKGEENKWKYQRLLKM